MEIPGLKIFHYCGGLNFASRQSFRKDVYRIAGIVPQKELQLREKAASNDNKVYPDEDMKKVKPQMFYLYTHHLHNYRCICLLIKRSFYLTY